MRGAYWIAGPGIIGLVVVMFLSTSGCQGIERARAEQPADPTETSFQVYHLHHYGLGGLDQDEFRTFRGMVEDAVGREMWIRSGSTMRLLEDVMTVRTTREGHERIEQLLVQLRAGFEDR